MCVRCQQCTKTCCALVLPPRCRVTTGHFSILYLQNFSLNWLRKFKSHSATWWCFRMNQINSFNDNSINFNGCNYDIFILTQQLLKNRCLGRPQNWPNKIKEISHHLMIIINILWTTLTMNDLDSIHIHGCSRRDTAHWEFVDYVPYPDTVGHVCTLRRYSFLSVVSRCLCLFLGLSFHCATPVCPWPTWSSHISRKLAVECLLCCALAVLLYHMTKPAKCSFSEHVLYPLFDHIGK